MAMVGGEHGQSRKRFVKPRLSWRNSIELKDLDERRRDSDRRFATFGKRRNEQLPEKLTTVEVSEMIRLWFPHRRCLGGICLGAARREVLELGEFFEDENDGSDDFYFLQQFFPNLSVAMSDGVVVSIAARDECFLDDINLIDLPLEFAASLLGGITSQTDSGEVDIYITGSGVELYVRDDRVSRVILSDWSLVRESTKADRREQP